MQHIINGLCGFFLFAMILDWTIGQPILTGLTISGEVLCMSNSRMVLFLMLCVSILSMIALAEDENYSVNISVNKFLGSYLVNETGFALYYYQNDSSVQGMSTCDGDCAKMWPPFYVKNLTLPQSLNPLNFGTIERADGSKQTTFKDWPLYLYSKDSSPGDVRGNGLGDDQWHVVVPENQPRLI